MPGNYLKILEGTGLSLLFLALVFIPMERVFPAMMWQKIFRPHWLTDLPAFILGFPLETLAGLIAFRGIWAIYIHSNVRLPLGPLRMIIGSPELHHWHHDLARDAGNYANISPLMDIIFGTYTYPDHEPEKFGIRENFPKSYFSQLIRPLLPERIGKRIWVEKFQDDKPAGEK